MVEMRLCLGVSMGYHSREISTVAIAVEKLVVLSRQSSGGPRCHVWPQAAVEITELAADDGYENGAEGPAVHRVSYCLVLNGSAAGKAQLTLSPNPPHTYIYIYIYI